MALLLTLHRLVALTFKHTAASLVPCNSQTHNHFSNCPTLPGPSDNQLAFTDPLSPPYLPGQFIYFLASLGCPSLALTLTCTTPPAPVSDTTNTWLCPQVWTPAASTESPIQAHVHQTEVPPRKIVSNGFWCEDTAACADQVQAFSVLPTTQLFTDSSPPFLPYPSNSSYLLLPKCPRYVPLPSFDSFPPKINLVQW